MTQLEIQQQISSIFNNSGAENSASEFLKNATEICLENDSLKAKLSQSESFCKDILNRLEKVDAELELRKHIEQQNVALKAENAELKHRQQSLENESWQKTQQLNVKDSEIAKLREEFTQRNEEIQKAFQKQNADLQSENSQLKAHQQGLVNDSWQKQQLLNVKESELIKLGEELVALRAKCEEYVKEKSGLSAQLLQSQNMCNENTRRYEDAQKNFQKQNTDLQSKNFELTDKISQLKLELEQKNAQLDVANSKISDFSIQMGALQSISKKYSSLDILPYYEKLSDKMKSNLSKIFPNVSTEGLLASGIQWELWKQLYHMLYDDVIEDRMDDYEMMNKIIHKLFEIYNYGQCKYVIIEPEIGSKFNPLEQSIKGFKTDGAISRVLLFGYKTQKGEVIEKAFVSVN